ncbi:MAG: hypothetical protein ACI399_02590 [Candidatus Cryptobacteroides sp.]
MKKSHSYYLCVIASIAIAVVVVSAIQNSKDSLFDKNVEALAEGEQHALGYCDNSVNQECIGVCEDCGAVVYASGFKGIGYNIHHK